MLVPVWLGVLWLAAAYLIFFGLAVILKPARTRKFLSSFAQSTMANLTEAGLRATVGLAFVGASGSTKAPEFSILLGLFLAVSAVLMALLPGLHRRFAARATASVFKMFPALGVMALMLATALAWFVA